MKILSIDTSCDETCAAVTEGTTVLSNIVWSQASLHAKWGGVYPSLAQREHQERIAWVITQALQKAKTQMPKIDAIAVTVGPGLAIALEVGITKAKEIAIKYHLPLISINHIEAHLLSALAQTKPTKIREPKRKEREINLKTIFPTLGLVVSGGTTQFILARKYGQYKILATTMDDALGEALDKGARLLGLGYPGGAILEKFSKLGKPQKYSLPIPMIGRESSGFFSYSGLKTALVRQVKTIQKQNRKLTSNNIYNLAFNYQNIAFEHLIRIILNSLSRIPSPPSHLLVGGGVSVNMELRKRLRKICQTKNIQLHFPYSKKLCTDNAAMVGIVAYLKLETQGQNSFIKPKQIDRKPKWSLEEP